MLFKQSRYAPIFLLFLASFAIFFVTRIVLLVSFGKEMDASFINVIGSFLIGMFYDAAISLVIVLPFVFQITFTNEFIYTKKGKLATILFFVLIIGMLFFTSILPKDYNKDLFTGVSAYLISRFAVFLFLCKRSLSFRLAWRDVLLRSAFFLICFVLLFNAVSEWFFWNEFRSRYNFIAVDYLIYTNEVLGNIWESYHIIYLLIAIAMVTIGIYFFVKEKITVSVRSCMGFGKRILVGTVIIVIALSMIFALPTKWKYFSNNNYANELAGNGIYDFAQAFKNNELDFYSYYKSIPDSTAFTIIRKELDAPYSRFLSDDLFDIRRQISYKEAEKKMNVVLISVESFSASFMRSFGSTKNITPHLDSLAQKSLLFTNLYASGTRTVRGLEALSLSLPPLPGQSLVKRPDNENLFSLGSVFKDKGYITQYIYGGYGYFDNMNYFFGHNGYDVIDRSAIKENEVHYANIWGVADEDLFTLALHTMDDNYKKGMPFFSQVMTVSNHRPYTYPENRIDIAPSNQSRDGAVEYTDYAIGRFIKEASTKPWFNNTVFVIVADHCASSAGKQALPMLGYHIPMIIYSPSIAPKQITSLTAQIDIAPTILGLLNFNYTSKFLGQDVLNIPDDKQRAFISTYQGLGFIKSGELVVQSPIKKLNSYKADPLKEDAIEIKSNDEIVNKAISYYQVAAWLIKNKRYNFSK